MVFALVFSYTIHAVTIANAITECIVMRVAVASNTRNLEIDALQMRLVAKKLSAFSKRL